MPPTSVKKLYVAKSLDELERSCQVDSDIHSKNTAGLIGFADRIFSLAELDYSEKDDEQAFIQYSKYVELVSILKLRPEFQKYPIHIKFLMNVKRSIKRIDQLKERLFKRYQYQDEDCIPENRESDHFAALSNNSERKRSDSECSNHVESLTANGMEGPTAFSSDVKKQVFDFFVSILRNYPEPVYYEYVRGHVAKAPLAVRKYVTSKLRGDKLLEYFGLRKNYFTVDGSEVVLNKNPVPKRTRGRSECVTRDTSRERKSSTKRDKSRSKRSLSCSSALSSENTIAAGCSAVSSENTTAANCVSSSNGDEKLEHEDYVNKFFFDLIIRHEKVDVHSLEYDFLPKKVKRHLDVYYKRKVANYFAQFPDKYILDDDMKVSFNLQCPKDSCITTESKPNEIVPPQKETLVENEKQSPSCEDKEILTTFCHADAVLFFMEILTKKKNNLPVHQLAGYLAQAPKELKSYLKSNFEQLKNFFEECPSVFFLDSSENVKVSKLSMNHKSIYEDMRRAAHKASVGDISFKSFKEKVELLRNKIKTLSDEHSDKQIENGCKVSADEPLNSSNSPKSSAAKQHSTATVKTNSNELNGLGESKSQHEFDPFAVREETKEARIFEVRSVGTQHEPHDLSKMKIDVEEAISQTLSNYEYYGITSENIIFEINGDLYEPTCKPFKGTNYFYENDKNADEAFKAGMKRVIRIVPTPCQKHKKLATGGEDTVDMKSQWTKHIVKINDQCTYRFLVMVELLCLEITEEDFEFTVSSEMDAVQYFIDVLKQPSRKGWTAVNLHGTIGKASAEVALYIRKKYKPENFESFFKKQPEFEVHSPIIKLSSSHEEIFARRLKALSVSANRNSKWDLLKLFESSCYQSTLKEILSLLLDVCNYLKNRFKAKITKLENIVKKYPMCSDWIKRLEGETLAKKTKFFFDLFDIFDFPTGQYISFPISFYNDTMLKLFENSLKKFDNSKTNFDLVSYFLSLTKAPSASPEDKKSNVVVKEFWLSKFCYSLTEAIKSHTPTGLFYHELDVNLSDELVDIFIENGITSRNLIDAILKDGQYFLKICEITLKTSEVNCDGLDSSANSFSSDNKILESQAETCARSDKVISSEASSTGNKNEDDCANSVLLESGLLHNSITSCVKESDKSNALIGNQFDIQTSITKCDTKTPHSMVVLPLKDSTEHLKVSTTARNTDSTSDDKSLTNDAVPHENGIEKETDFSIDEIESLLALGEKHSLSENMDLTLVEEDIQVPVETIKSVSDAESPGSPISCQVSNTEEQTNEKSVDMIKNSLKTILESGKRMNKKVEVLHQIYQQFVDGDKDSPSFLGICNSTANFQRTRTANVVTEYCNKFNNDPNSIDNETDCIDVINQVNQIYSRLHTLDAELNLNNLKTQKYLKLVERMQNDICGDVTGSNEGIAMPTALLNCSASAIELKEENKVNGVVSSIKSLDSHSNVCDHKLTADSDLNCDIVVPFEVASQDELVSTNKACLPLPLNDCKGFISETRLLEEISSTNDKGKSASLGSSNDKECDTHSQILHEGNLNDNLESSETLKSIDNMFVPIEYPLQPISAEIVLLTADSCIAVATISSRKQNIYFLKCVFVCDNQYCSSECFNELKVGDTVSCFVPPNEISRKMWVGFMVSKESSPYFDEINSFNETTAKQIKDNCAYRTTCVNSTNVSTQTEDSSIQHVCFSNGTSQTDVTGDIKLCAITKDSVCQVMTSVDICSTQTENMICSSECQTETTDTSDMESQTIPEESKEIPNCIEMSCQTTLTGEVKETRNVTNNKSQTISTGVVMITKYYHL